ncbi:MAG TPA: NnrS family protein, partial [Acidobacteriota bacterium]|nr:NnrS family protein [Acidobacteriota bacterium]
MNRDELRIDSDTLLPDLFERYPQTRLIFDQYGLKGCGGRSGPVETIRFFSRTHGVDEEMLLQEIKQSVRGGSTGPQSTAPPGVADTIYRRFFVAGILLVLTLGASWGAWLLWQIGATGSFTSASIHQVNAHGHAQIFGWVGLFIMGFAYQAFPRMWHRELMAPRLAVATFLMMLVGIIIRTTGMALTESVSWAVPAVLAGGILQSLAIVIFAAQLVVTFRSSGTRWEPYIGFVTAALIWFVIMGVFSLWHTVNTMTAASRADLLYYISTYQTPLRDLQIHGLALFMILGVSIRMLPALFDVAPVPRGRAWKALVILVLGLLGEIFFFVLFHTTGNVIWAFALLGAWVLLAIGVVSIVLHWKLWRPFPAQDRSAKFVRTAYLWLLVSLAMLILMPIYLRLSGTVFSHAYYGAARHAITVGFISLMIMGIAAKVVPTLNGL